jgi:hypothetical protein
MKINKLSSHKIGLFQAVCVLFYCFLVAGFVMLMETFAPKQDNAIGMVAVLMLLVISAGVTGFLVFGYAAYSAINKNIKRAIQVLGYTFLYLVLFFFLVLFFLFCKSSF